MSVPKVATTLAAVALVTACTPSASNDDPGATTTSQTVTVASTSTSVTTTAPQTTTTTPIVTVDVTMDDPAIAEAAATFLAAAADDRNDATGIDPELLAHHRGLEPASTYTATATTADLDELGSVGVVELGGDNAGDILLVADDGDGWFVVGAALGTEGFSPWFGPSPRRVLVIGTDARWGANAPIHRSDSIHLLTAVPDSGEGTILGFPRDIWSDTPWGEMRINALSASGRGPDALVDHMQEAYDIPVEGYVLTAFSGFEDLIAATVGRVTIVLPRSVPSLKYWPGFGPGEQRLTPQRTLDLARTRKGVPGGDFTRSWNQGLIMLAVLMMLQERPIAEVPLLVSALVDHTDTDLSAAALVQLAATAFMLDPATIANEVLPARLGRAGNGASVVFLEPEAPGIIADTVDDGLRNDSAG